MCRRARTRLCWQPEWEGSVKNWACKFIHKNKWRCDSVHSFEDLLQDAYLVYHKIVERYPRVIEPAHFLALYRTALWNEFHDRARYMRRKREVHRETSSDVSEFDGRIGEMSNGGYIALLLADAPEELKLALEIINTDVTVLRAKVRGKPNENLNRKLRRALGWDRAKLDEHRNYDFMGQLKMLLADGAGHVGY